MAKTLVIAEKPSVGRDLTGVLPGSFTKHEGYLESDSHVVTWAVGHLVQLAEPDEYDPKYKKWRMADLPIVPDAFRLVVRDERSRKQMTVITKELGRKDIDNVVNACDAGREGELIFAWLYEKAGAKKPVQRLWLSSMTKAAIKQAFQALRPGRGVQPPRGGRALALRGRLDRRHERHARRDHPPALLLRRRRLARPRADADARDRRPPRGRDPRVQAREVLARRREVRAAGRARRAAPTRAGTTPAPSRASPPPPRPTRSSPPSRARPARSPSSRRRRRRSARRSSTT